MKDLSIIAPLYNEEETVKLLYEAIVRVVEPLRLDHEILFVDDGSKDMTFRVARELAERDKRLRVIRFRRNFGQTPAMAAGIDHARGNILITMDGDLQEPPGGHSPVHREDRGGIRHRLRLEGETPGQTGHQKDPLQNRQLDHRKSHGGSHSRQWLLPESVPE